MRVLALTKYERQAASTRQRLLQYLPFLADQGIEVDVKPLFNAQYLSDLAQNKPKNRLLVAKSYINRLGVLLKNHDYDLNWIHFEALPFMPAFVELLAMKGGPPFMVDMDDAIFHQYDAHANGAVRKALGGKIATLLDHAALVVAGNAYLAEYVRSHADVRVIPTVVDIEAYIPTKQDSSPTSRGGTVGWIGSPSTWRYVEPILPELLPLIERAGWRFRAVGAGPMADRHAGVDNIPLTKYLIQQVMNTQEERLATLREYLPQARLEDWTLVNAGQRVQIVKDDPKKGGILQFGTEVVASSDGSVTALLGASPGASVTVSIMLELIERCFPEQYRSPAWTTKLQAMFPARERALATDAVLYREVFDRNNAQLGLVPAGPAGGERYA